MCVCIVNTLGVNICMRVETESGLFCIKNAVYFALKMQFFCIFVIPGYWY